MIQAKLVQVAMDHPELFVANIVYLDSKGNVTQRPVSPIRYLPDRRVRVYCLGRLALRTLKLSMILRVQLQLSHDVLAPEQVKELVSHRRKLRQTD